MIAFLKGKLELKQPTRIILNVGNIGFEINIPLSTFDQLAEINSEIKVLTYLNVKEDSLTLYGFFTSSEKEMFKQLISVTGIGPKAALSILSHLSVEAIKAAILKEEVSSLQNVHGIGRKKAERIILELKEKIDEISKEIFKLKTGVDKKTETMLEDAIAALCSLGYQYNQAKQAVNKAAEELSQEYSLEKLIKEAFKEVK